MRSLVAQLGFGLLAALLLCGALSAAPVPAVHAGGPQAMLRAGVPTAAGPAKDGVDDLERSSPPGSEQLALPAGHDCSRLTHARAFAAPAPVGPAQVFGGDPLLGCAERLTSRLRTLALQLRSFRYVRDPGNVADRPTVEALPLRGPPRAS